MIQVSVPSMDNWKTEMAASMVDMFTHSIIKGIPCILNYAQGSQLDRMRNMMVEDALNAKHETTHILFIDSDQTFPPDTLERLVSRKKHVIGAIVTQRKPPFRTNCSLDGEHLFTDGREGVQRVNTLGMGVTLIDANVFRKVPAPWFLFGWDIQKQMHVGEDVGFCREVDKAGFEIWVDHDLSKDVSHIGSLMYGPREAAEYRDAQTS